MHSVRWTRGLVGVVALAALLAGCATLEQMGTGGGPLDEGTVVAGLKEALRVGSQRTTARTAAVDGFLGNDLIRIPLPRQLESAAATLRSVGLGSHVTELETAMNRAAEAAAGEAGPVLRDAITAMTIGDAFAILEGHETAATDYFRARTEDRLRSRFRPIVAAKTAEVGLGRIYDDLADRYDRIPLMGKPELVDLDAYVTDEALDGLFTVLGQEERTIREDPVARTTELLRRVFGRG